MDLEAETKTTGRINFANINIFEAGRLFRV